MIQNTKLFHPTLLVVIALLFIIPAYAGTTIITDTSVSSTNGFFSGDVNATRVFANTVQLAGTEGSFTSWSPIFNASISGTSFPSTANYIIVSNNGTIAFREGPGDFTVMKKDGTILKQGNDNGNPFNVVIDRSLTGKYLVVLDCGSCGNTAFLQIFKNDALVQTVTIGKGSFFTPSAASISISSSGRYIALGGQSPSNTGGAVVILQGS